MKRIGFLAIVLVAICSVYVATSGQSNKTAPGKSSPGRDLMRQKLTQAQSVLEGISLEDFSLIARQARKLGVLSQQGDWADSTNPQYTRHVEAFKHNVAALAKAADEHNLDAVTLAYVKVTMDCVECHKFVRGRKTAALPMDKTLLRSIRPQPAGNLN